MEMKGWQDHLHFALGGEHVLLPDLHLDSPWKFIVASFLAVVVCSSERMLTYAISKHWAPLSMRRTRLRIAMWRAILHWFVTFSRLMYMLIAMTFNVGLIVITVTTLSFGQFIIEYIDTPPDTFQHDPERMHLKEPLLSAHYCDASSAADAPQPMPIPRLMTPPRRPRSKPTNLFIHPNDSNVVRAELAARQLGFSARPSPSPLAYAQVRSQTHAPADNADTGLGLNLGLDVVGDGVHPEDGDGWALSSGRETARELLDR